MGYFQQQFVGLSFPHWAAVVQPWLRSSGTSSPPIAAVGCSLLGTTRGATTGTWVGGVGSTQCDCGVEELCCVGLRVGTVWLWGRGGRRAAVGWAGSCHGYGVHGGSLSTAVGQICLCCGYEWVGGTAQLMDCKLGCMEWVGMQHGCRVLLECYGTPMSQPPSVSQTLCAGCGGRWGGVTSNTSSQSKIPAALTSSVSGQTGWQHGQVQTLLSSTCRCLIP